MLDLKGLKKVVKKLNKDEAPGEIIFDEEGRKEIRVSYLLNEEMRFTFGLTRSSRAKSKRFSYIPRQMGLKTGEYRKLHDYPWTKKDFNRKLLESEED